MTLSRHWRKLLTIVTAATLVLGTAVAAQADDTVAGMQIVTTTSAPQAAGPSSEPCWGSNPDRCASTDPTVTLSWEALNDTSACTFRVDFIWGDGSALQSETFRGGPAGTVRSFSHTYPHRRASDRKQYPIQATGTVVSGQCWISSTSPTYTLLCTAEQLSGPSWSGRWPGTHNVSDLDPDFRGRVSAFMGAMGAAGISVRVSSTFRPYERSYLMHWSYLIVNNKVAPEAVPAFSQAGHAEMDICWAHRDAEGDLDLPASTTAALRLLRTLGVDPTLKTAPALASQHNIRQAIDMNTKWSDKSITIKNAAGENVTITSKPRRGTNPDLMAVGASYGVHHFVQPEADKNHWSNNGH